VAEPGRQLREVIKHSVRLGIEAGTVEPTASGQSAVVEDLLTPMSLTAYLEADGATGLSFNRQFGLEKG